MGSARAPRVVFGAPTTPQTVHRPAPPARCPARAPGRTRGARALPIFRPATASFRLSGAPLRAAKGAESKDPVECSIFFDFVPSPPSPLRMTRVFMAKTSFGNRPSSAHRAAPVASCSIARFKRPLGNPENQGLPHMAPAVGFEPTTNRLTVDRSTTELRWIFVRKGGALYGATPPLRQPFFPGFRGRNRAENSFRGKKSKLHSNKKTNHASYWIRQSLSGLATKPPHP